MINTEAFKMAIGALYKITPQRSPMPILQTVLARGDGRQLQLSATNLEFSLTLYVDSDTQLNACIPAKTLNELLSVISAHEIDIVQKDSSVVVKRNPGNSTLKTLNPSDFPLLEIPETGFDVDCAEFNNALYKCLSSASEDKTHPVLTGVLMQSQNNIFTVCSADGFRLTHIKMLFGLPDFEVIIPAEAIKVLLQVMKTGKAKMTISTNQVVFYNDDFTFTSQLIAGSYPEVAKIIPAKWETTVEIDKTILTKAVKASMIFAKDSANIITFKIENDVIVVSGESSETGNDVTPIKQFVVRGNPINEFAINGKFLLEGLSLCPSKLILKLNSATHPIGLFIPEDETFTHIMMPMQLGKR